MNPKQITPQSLLVELDRSCFLVGVILVSSWFFAAFSYFLSRRTGTDWFSRSGSVMCPVGAASTFRLAGFLQQKLATALKQGFASVEREIELILDPPHRYQLVLYVGYATGIVGTVIWGYGDMLPRLLAK
ncbi:hypothetical protein RBB78_14395 [Tunturiibacter empetritectus]|uniref:hypothetical protein n=1 Tax=Tunturiibacter empetritectus TaxID=3069691 RepID=UPI003D9B90A0